MQCRSKGHCNKGTATMAHETNVKDCTTVEYFEQIDLHVQTLFSTMFSTSFKAAVLSASYVYLNPLPHMQILGSSNSPADKYMISTMRTNRDTCTTI